MSHRPSSPAMELLASFLTLPTHGYGIFCGHVSRSLLHHSFSFDALTPWTIVLANTSTPGDVLSEHATPTLQVTGSSLTSASVNRRAAFSDEVIFSVSLIS
jgi:hypothetical protein